MAYSNGNSPHRFSGNVDSFYDPDFTADISNKMRVPDRIVIDNDNHSANRSGQQVNGFDGPDFMSHISHKMQVPDRIVFDADTSVNMNGLDEPLLTDDTSNKMQVPYRIVMEGDHEGANKSVTAVNGFGSAVMADSIQSPNYQSFYNSSQSEEGTAGLRRQLKAMSRRVAAIELENQNRRQREVIVYTLGVIYFLIKGIVWVQKRF